jgi:photosystem II stability/assembly factor-like uncharacterized protein
MSESCAAAGRAFLLAALAALAAACGPAPGSHAPDVKQVMPDSGPLPIASVRRLLLLDAARVGPRVVAVGDRGYIVVSDDDGASWKRAVAPAVPLLAAVDFVDAKDGWAVGHDSTILATSDGGDTWTKQFSAPSEQRPLLDVLFLSATQGIAVGAYGAYYETTDGGKSWNARKIIPEDRHFNAIVKVADHHLLIVGEEGTILVSADDGRTWTKVPSPYKGSLFGAVVAADGSVVAFGLRGRIYRSADAGQTWTQVDDATAATLMGGSRLPDGSIVVAGTAGTALVSRDNGRSFVALATGTTRAWSKAVLGAPNTAMLLGEAGAAEVPLARTRDRSIRGQAPDRSIRGQATRPSER